MESNNPSGAVTREQEVFCERKEWPVQCRVPTSWNECDNEGTEGAQSEQAKRARERERASLWMTCPASAYSSVLCGLGERVVPSSGGRTTIDESAKQHGRLAVRLGGYTDVRLPSV